MYAKEIDVIRKMLFQYDEIIEMQKAELAKLEISTPADSASK